MVDANAILADDMLSADADALPRLIVHCHSPLRGTVAAAVDPNLRRYVDPDDVLQQAYISAFKSLGGCRFDSPGHLYKWLEFVGCVP